MVSSMVFSKPYAKDSSRVKNWSSERRCVGRSRLGEEGLPGFFSGLYISDKNKKPSLFLGLIKKIVFGLAMALFFVSGKANENEPWQYW